MAVAEVATIIIMVTLGILVLAERSDVQDQQTK
jgi:L-asparagine transporter-like permease